MIENYQILENGVIKQKKILHKIQDYNYDYINKTYNTYGEKAHQMAGLRLGYLIGLLGRKPESILDVGYGNGDFLKLCKEGIEKCYGNDVSGYPLPHNVIFVDDIFKDEYDVICFFDVLEHFENIDFIKDLKCNYIYISVPWCHNFSDEWFYNWKHRKVDEHLWHFNDKSIKIFFEEMGYDLISISNIEDIIRHNNEEYENILTALFIKK